MLKKLGDYWNGTAYLDEQNQCYVFKVNDWDASWWVSPNFVTIKVPKENK